ncbi:MAG: glycosyltransferase [Clostridiales bacterium]|nr:glycosyltransferase [Clostridiales bacterium]
MKKIRILFVMCHMDFGGAQKSLLNLLSCMAPSRYDIDLLLFDRRGAYLPYIPEYVNVLPQSEELLETALPMAKYSLAQLKRGRPGAIWARFSFAVRKRFSKSLTPKQKKAQLAWSYMRTAISPLKKEYDVAVGFLHGACNYYVAEKVTARRKIGWLHTDYDAGGYSPQISRPYLQKLDSVVGVSTAITAGLAAHFPDMADKFHTILNIIPCGLTRKLSLESGGFPDPEFTGIRLLTIGRLSAEKSYDFAVKACAELVRRGHNVRWYVLGRGSLEEQIGRWIAEEGMEQHFFLLGATPNPYPYLRQCDIYVQPSRFEGCSMVLTEAKVLGRPCVATNYQSVGDQIRHEETGIITEMNFMSVADGIERLIRDPALCERLRDHLRDFCGTEAEYEKYDALFSENL